LGSEELLRLLAQAHENLGETEDALKWLEQANQLNSQSVDTLKALARVQMQLKQYEAAERNIRKAISIGGENESVLFTLSTALVRQKRMDEATEIRKQIQEKKAESSGTKDNSQNGNGFQEGYTNALRRIAYNLQLSAASIANQNQNNVQAEKWVRDAIAIYPDRSKAYQSLASLYLEENRIGDAIALHELLVQKQPENVFNVINLASLVSQVGEMERAVEILEAAVESDPEGTIAQAALAKLYVAQRNGEAARRMAAEVLERNPSVEAYALMAAAYETSGQQRSAEAAIQRARQLWPEHPMWRSDPGATQSGTNLGSPMSPAQP
ncbi:MAG: tetratricopeptide repeat protein, partial [Planctomycetota bacterium]